MARHQRNQPQVHLKPLQTQHTFTSFHSIKILYILSMSSSSICVFDTICLGVNRKVIVPNPQKHKAASSL